MRRKLGLSLGHALLYAMNKNSTRSPTLSTTPVFLKLDMLEQAPLLLEALAALAAGKGPQAGMGEPMGAQLEPGAQHLVAHGAGAVGGRAQVHHLPVLLQRFGRAVGLGAQVAGMGSNPGVQGLVVHAVALVVEGLGAAATATHFLRLCTAVEGGGEGRGGGGGGEGVGGDLVDVLHVTDEILAQQETLLAHTAGHLRAEKLFSWEKCKKKRNFTEKKERQRGKFKKI